MKVIDLVKAAERGDIGTFVRNFSDVGGLAGDRISSIPLSKMLAEDPVVEAYATRGRQYFAPHISTGLYATGIREDTSAHDTRWYSYYISGYRARARWI